MLTLSRAVQGIGGAMLFATSLALIASAFHGRERGTAFAVWGATTGIAVAVGPLVGGALTDGIGWESIFLVNVPIGIGVYALVLRLLPASPGTAAGARLDVEGAVTITGSLELASAAVR